MKTLNPIPTLRTWKQECQQCAHVPHALSTVRVSTQHQQQSEVLMYSPHTNNTLLCGHVHMCTLCCSSVGIVMTACVMTFSHEPHSCCVSCYSWTWTRLTCAVDLFGEHCVGCCRWCPERLACVSGRWSVGHYRRTHSSQLSSGD